MTLQPGSRLGAYEILDPLGAGGMGEVYRARDRKLGRDVAIKVLPEEFARDPARLARFEREARMLAAVNHPTIAAIYGAEEDGATRYIVMELVEGDTLMERLGSGPLAIPDALRVAGQIAEALEVAHEKGVIHRDLKPANIKITPAGKVKVLDFGLAKAMELPFAGDMSRSPTIVMDDSRPGEIVGTPEFMSPEQARGKETDRRTDIWALGCILYEMLSGRRAFTGETVPDAVSAILSREPDWSALPARTPERIRELLRKCLEKDSGRRLRDAGDARLETEAALAAMSGAGMTAPASPSVPWRAVAAGAVALTLAILAYVAVRSKPAAAAATGVRHLAVLPFVNMTNRREGELMGLALADTVGAQLSDVPGLQVVTPRATVEAVNENPDASRVARRLGANTLLFGTLQWENDRYRITYRLVDASGNHIAANSLDGSALFDLQDRIAAGVVRDLRLRRTMRRTPTPSGLETLSEQERYLQAIGLLQRYDRREGVEQAVQILRKLAEENPGSALVQSALGRASLAMFDFTSDVGWAERAAAAADSARALDPSLPEVDIILGETLLATGRAKEAAEAFHRALAANPNRVEAFLGLGEASTLSGDPAGGEAALKRAVALQPAFASYNRLGHYYAGRGRWADAADMFRRAIRLAPDSYRALSNLGGVLVGSCDFPAAIETFRRALALDPRNPIAASNLGLTLLWTGRTAEALKILEPASRESPKDYRIWGNLGDAYRAASGAASQSDEAYARSITLARERLRLNPTDSEAQSFVATGLARTGHVREAGREMQKALALADRDPNLLADAAIVAVLSDQSSEALEWLRKAVAAGYCRAIIARQPEFARLRENPDFRSIVAAPRAAAGS